MWRAIGYRSPHFIVRVRITSVMSSLSNIVLKHEAITELKRMVAECERKAESESESVVKDLREKAELFRAWAMH
jgi:hypothetical protein